MTHCILSFFLQYHIHLNYLAQVARFAAREPFLNMVYIDEDFCNSFTWKPFYPAEIKCLNNAFISMFLNDFLTLAQLQKIYTLIEELKRDRMIDQFRDEASKTFG